MCIASPDLAMSRAHNPERLKEVNLLLPVFLETLESRDPIPTISVTLTPEVLAPLEQMFEAIPEYKAVAKKHGHVFRGASTQIPFEHHHFNLPSKRDIKRGGLPKSLLKIERDGATPVVAPEFIREVGTATPRGGWPTLKLSTSEQIGIDFTFSDGAIWGAGWITPVDLMALRLYWASTQEDLKKEIEKISQERLKSPHVGKKLIRLLDRPFKPMGAPAEASQDLKPLLTTETLAPMLKSSHEELRMKALLWLGEIEDNKREVLRPRR